jgi:hypothetical protein
MPSGNDQLNRQIRTWLSVRNMGSMPVPPPEINPPPMPDPSRVELKTVPRLQGSIERLAVSHGLGGAVPALASLMSVMDRMEAEGIYNFLIGLIIPDSYDPGIAENWFRQCHTLRSSQMPFGVRGFFELLEAYSPDSFGITFIEALACWLKALRSAGSIASAHVALPLKVARTFPERFGFVCLRMSSGGTDIVTALEKFFSRIDEEGIGDDAAAMLLDYTIETGWLLDDSDYRQIWNLIKRRGRLVHGRLSRGLVPVSSIRFLAGILSAIESRRDLEEFFSSERVHKVMELFDTHDRKRVAAILESSQDLRIQVDHQLEMDLVIEAVSHGIAGSDHAAMGEAIVSFLHNVPGGISLGKLVRFLKAIGEEISGEVLQFLARLVEDTPPEERLSPSNTIRFSRIVAGILPVSVTSDRTALKAFYRSLVEMSHTEARNALIQLDTAAFHSGISISSVLAASSLLIRAAEPEETRRYLERIPSTARLVELLSAIDRKKTLSGLAPLWVEVILSFPEEVEKTIIDFMGRINDVTVRCRYLENVVTRLLQEVQPEDPVFRECLAFAVTGYNSAGDIDRLRDTEHRVFQKVLRAGGRIEAVDRVITDLLGIPGFEGNRSEELITGIRTICDRFSRTAVWEEGADRLFSRFLKTGVSNILRVFVDNPQTLENIDSSVIEELAEKLMPGETSTASSGVTGTGATAGIFFGSILPDCVALLAREPALLVPFLFSVAEEITRSIGGMTGDSEFAQYLVRRLDQEILQDRVTVLDSWLSQKTPPPLYLDPSWPGSRREEYVARKSVFENARMKLYGAVSALVGNTGAETKEMVLNVAGILAAELRTAKVPGAGSLSLNWNRGMMEDLISRSQGVAPFSLFAANRAGAYPPPEVLDYLEGLEGFMEQDLYSGWRQAALPPLLNCAVEIVLASKNSHEKAMSIARAATDAIEFLGFFDSVSFLSTLKESLYNQSGGMDPCDLMEKSFLQPLWRRNSAERLDLLILGMEKSSLLMSILLERLAMEKTVSEKISFMNRYSNFFISVEEALLEIESDSVRSRIAEALMESWIFSGTGTSDRNPVEEISEAVDFVKDVFRRVRYGGGIVSAREAGEISADMRRKYRDNADSVAIILRWTVDPAREGLLKMLEESQTLLQAAGSDSELMRLLDIHGADEGFVNETISLVEKPGELKEYLRARQLKAGGG